MVRARCIVQCTFAHPWWRTIKPETKNNTWTRTGYNTRTSRSAQQTSAGVRKRHIQRRGNKIEKIHRENPTSNDMKTRTRKRGATSAMKREKEREKTMSCGTAARKMHYIRYTSAFTILRIMSLGCVCVCVCVCLSECVFLHVGFSAQLFPFNSFHLWHFVQNYLFVYSFAFRFYCDFFALIVCFCCWIYSWHSMRPRISRLFPLQFLSVKF